MNALPPAILFDMDDTILSAYGKPQAAWEKVSREFAADLGGMDGATLSAALTEFARDFWADTAMHKHWRLNLNEARRRVAEGGFRLLSERGHRIPATDVMHRLADRFSALREEEMHLFPGALETLGELKRRGVKMALITNGEAEIQRAKVIRFGLEPYFDHVQIEGEHGFGKPEDQAYFHAMRVLGVSPSDTWMVGDNLEWEVVTPQRLGIYAIWCDAHQVGLPAGGAIRPDRIIRYLPELLEPQALEAA